MNYGEYGRPTPPQHRVDTNMDVLAMRMCDMEGRLAERPAANTRHTAAAKNYLRSMSGPRGYGGSAGENSAPPRSAAPPAMRRNRGIEAEFWAQEGGLAKPEGKRVEEERRHCFGGPGGTIVTERTKARAAQRPPPTPLQS